MSQHKREEELVIIKVLQNDSTVSGITTSIVPDMEDEGQDAPFVVVHRIIGNEDKTKEDEPTKITRVQVDCWGNTKAQANNLADAVESALKGYSGTTYGSIDVNIIQHESDNPSEFNQKNRRYKTSDDYNVKVKV